MTPEDTLAELWAELGKGGVTEAHITAPDMHVDGLCVFPHQVYVNPAPNIVLTLLHELMHRRHPRWSERRVDRESKALLGHMSDKDVKRWYRAYQKAKRVSTRTVRAK